MKHLLTMISCFAATTGLADPYDQFRVNCDSAQIATTGAAIDKAKELLQNAAYSIPANNSATGQKFKRWFGGPEGSTDTILRDIYIDLQTRVIFTKYWCPPPANFPGDERHPNTFAWVPSDSQTEIFLEQRFFEADATCEDSQPGTIIHELSHNSTVANVVDTDIDGDKEPDYGVANAQALSASDHTKARRTADNIQYYAEDLFWGIN